MRRGQTVAGLLLGVGLWFAVLGQFYFAYRREYVWDGVFFWCVAGLAFGLLLRQMARVEQIKKYKILPADWEPGGDELTPTMKLKRKPIAEKYAAEIEALYS